ncbi:MAG: hypothetical protein L0Z50_36430 [Verrucomicrobiales bacterium]|nr:hypothetical protein [Verrucomicrobiales bacterium]
MSANEVIEQIEQLPLEEQKKVFSYVLDKRDVLRRGASEPVSSEFKKVTERVFVRNAELFRKLAQ